MNRGDIAKVVAGKAGITNAQANEAVDVVLDTIKSGVKSEGNLILKGFGTFKKKATKERKARNPKTGEAVLVPAGEKVSFKASKEFLD